MHYPRGVSSSVATPPLDPGELAPVAELARALVDACAGAVRAPRASIENCVIALLSGGHVMIEDVPGVGKTVLGKSLARAAGCEFSRLQCTADLLPADVTGVTVWDQNAAAFVFRPGPVFANVILVDEINRASPKTQSALLECMEEGQVTVDGETRVLPRPFMIIATQNPVEYEGTFPLPEAQLDRFAVRVAIGYPAPRPRRRCCWTWPATTRWRGSRRSPTTPGSSRHARWWTAFTPTRRSRSTWWGWWAPRGAIRARSSGRARGPASPCCAPPRPARSWTGAPTSCPRTCGALRRPCSATGSILTPDARARGALAGEIVADALAAVPVPL